MIKLSIDAMEIFDPSNPDSIRQYMIATNQRIDEIARKAQSTQDNVKSTAPAANDFESDFQTIPYDDGTNRRIYYLFKGTPRYIALT